MNIVPLSWWDVTVAALLLMINAGLSIRLQLHLEKSLVIAALRMVVQLSLVGLLLKTLFALVSPWLTAAVALLMILFAGYEAMARQERRLAGWWGYGLGSAAILLASTAVTVFALTSQVQPQPWYNPQYAIPLLGMILGNCMTGVALGLNLLFTRAEPDRASIEAMLALGYSRHEALKPLVRQAIKAGLIPIINAMAATGLISLPGMMTGQILAGVEPSQAVKYQMLIMFLIAGGTAIGLLVAVHGGALRLSDERHRLRLDRLMGGDSPLSDKTADESS
ncbi:MAG: iron export ABC transporter permease subunit FetB [Gammaproteobacteria bacterium]|nr:iron export ABC transporter permease subunit FetB [Gammaproteobacteria bacterium]